MKINFEQLKNLPVFTQSGDRLGTVHDLEFDTDTLGVTKLLVAPGLFKSLLTIDIVQVTSFAPDRVTVYDALEKAAVPTEA